jgi:hypothetical protein
MTDSQPTGEEPASGSQRIKINLPDYYKDVNQEVWEELEKYLFDGFLTTSAFVLGKTYVFKTLNHTEVRGMDFLKPMKSSPPEVRAAFRAAFIAHSILMVDGMNALHERPKHISRLIKIMSKIPQPIQEKIVENLAAVNERAARLYPLTEIYVHENRSRFRWMQLQMIPVHSTSASGIPGTEEVGMNYVQQAWTALNRILDRREDMERDWSHAKFIGSCFNGKGVRAIDERDKARAERERTDRDDQRIQVLYNYLNRGSKSAERLMELPDGRMAKVVKKFQAISPEELRDQLEAALAGEKDHHDLVVEAKQKQLIQRYNELEKHRQKMYAAPTIIPAGAQLTGASSTSGSRVIGGKAEADAYLARMEQLRLEGMKQMRQVMSPELNEPSDENPK